MSFGCLIGGVIIAGSYPANRPRYPASGARLVSSHLHYSKTLLSLRRLIVMFDFQVFPHKNEEEDNRTESKTVDDNLVDIHFILPFPEF